MKKSTVYMVYLNNELASRHWYLDCIFTTKKRAL